VLQPLLVEVIAGKFTMTMTRHGWIVSAANLT
jgi:hypothetical protein